MRIIAIGDLHGKTIWKDIIEKESFDIVVFIGDYFDCFEKITPIEQLQNFKEIIEFKESNPDKVKVLIGNHDFQYIWTISERYSGFQDIGNVLFGPDIDDAIKNDLLQACFIHDDIIFSHAGFATDWCENILGNKTPGNNDLFETLVNDMLKFQPSVFGFTPCGFAYSPYGDDETQTPIWIRPRALKRNRIPNYRQVVGHTAKDRIDLNAEIIVIDVLDKVNEYLIVNDGIFGIGKL